MRLPRDPVFHFPDEPPRRGGDGGGAIFVGALCVIAGVVVTYLLLNSGLGR